MTRKLFHITNSSVIFSCLVGLVCITNATVILGCLVYLVCHQPSPPSYLVAWFILFVITNATVILGRLVYLVCHQPSSPSYWLLGLSFKTTVPLTVKAKPTKNFSSKRKLPYHKIGRSACLSPPPFFLFKACTFYPCVPYFIFLSPLLNPLFLTPLPEV